MDNETLKELFIEQIRDIYDAEKQLTKALPKMAKGASSEELQEAITNHLEETQGQVGRLEKIFGLLKIPARSKSCKAMQGLVQEGSEALKEEEKGERRDLAIIAAAQRVEHYEISAYGTARAMAEHLNLPQIVSLLEATQEEETSADEKLTEVAQSLYQSEDEDMESEDEEMEPASPARGAAKKSSTGRTRSVA